MKVKETLFAPGELTDIILRVLGAGLLLGGSIAFPTLPLALGTLIKAINAFKKDVVSRRKVIRAIKLLETRRVISFNEECEEISVVVENLFKNRIITYSIAEILNYKKLNHKWDGRWYLVFFDVPEIQRNKRNQLRKLLKELGFYKYQESVYILPYDCESEVKLIGKIVEGTKYMKYIIAAKIQDEARIKTYFKII